MEQNVKDLQEKIKEVETKLKLEKQMSLKLASALRQQMETGGHNMHFHRLMNSTKILTEFETHQLNTV